jgi:phage tail-like protein
MAGTARSQSTDPFSSNRFHIVDTEGYLNLATPAAGFNSITLPTMNVEMIEYNEGLNLYAKKYPGRPTFDDVTMTKGVVKNDSAFAAWCRATAEGQPYRTNIVIRHFHRDDVAGQIDYSTARPYREIKLIHAWPISMKPGSDFDSLSSEISIEELTVTFEYFRIVLNGQEVQATVL